ncbi:MAG: XRE family transcriptional regulator [Chitinophagaceae bacterium]|nr:MAG: XRE family transcriptional regulator [Chitinophagaceae bacterium]
MRPLFGKTLEDLRKAHGLKQYQMAQRANVCRSTYGGWEKDKGCPTFVQVFLMAESLDERLEHVVANFYRNRDLKTGK